MKKELKSINELREYLRGEKYKYQEIYHYYNNLSETLKSQELRNTAYKIKRHIIRLEAIMDKTIELHNIKEVYDCLINEYRFYNDIVIYYSEQSKMAIQQELKNKYIELIDYFIIDVNTTRDVLIYIDGE